MIYALKIIAIIAVYAMILCVLYIGAKMTDEVKREDQKRGVR